MQQIFYKREHFPKLNNRQGDIKKRWYVQFYIWSPDENQFIRKLDFSMNSIKTIKERKEYCKHLMDQIRTMQQSNYVAKPEGYIDIPEMQESLSMLDAIQHVMRFKESTISKNTLRWYTTLYNALKAFQENPGLLKNWNETKTHAFLDWLKYTRKVSNKTYNNYLTTLHSAFEHLSGRKLIPENPTKHIKRLKTESKGHLPYTDEQIIEIKSVMKEMEEFQLLTFVQFIYYTLARPKEIRMLLVRDILKEKIIFKSINSKNRKSEYIGIPPGLEEIIENEKLREYPKDYYIFGYEGVPAAAPVGRDYFYDKHCKVLERLGMTHQDYTIYGYKHTGAINLYKACKDPVLVKAQCRHSNVNQTMTYLRDLGLLIDERIINQFPKF